MFRCDSCGAVFPEPVISREKENLDHENGWWEYVSYLCPYCGEDAVDKEGGAANGHVLR